MLRKLILVGMLTLVQQGSTVQICAGVAASFLFFAAHIHTMPYRHLEDNILKATTEVHLFVILLLVLTCKTDLESESVNVEHYDLVVTGLFVVFVPVAALLCIGSKWRHVAEIDIQASSLTTHTARLQAAFQRQIRGRDTDADRALLAQYISNVEDEINSDFHVFISYRVRTEAPIAKALFDQLSNMTLVESGQKLRVFLDAERLEDGER